ncbi:(Fe-S)-binding protein [Adhaeribacter radiodurans]|uniref:(Fe-S)-binding protein n=1 Tax=Adhaeribacter radiodurans TaxID=2745197 RepID=A0A7L7L696_9BACT|nr:(Fe-S)-binding protein [Adhaeribacter radiodurans]QMU28352.1 (Fe-S)-binding protein [Adhaeribacter radiodurans]
MTVGLFIPCYVDQFYPKVAIATLELLEKQGLQVVYPLNQTCCGQPMANSGFEHLTQGCNNLFIQNFKEVDYIVSPSGSCVLHIKDHLHAEVGKEEAAATHIRKKIYELTEFLTDVVKVENIIARFPHKVGMHQSCHGQRGLKLSQMTELVADPFSKPEKLLRMVEGLELIDLNRKDECCGFGGTFCVTEEAVSAKMGKDRVKDHLEHGAEYITGADMSCLMHLEGILRRQNSKVQVKHIAEILNSYA